MTLCVCVSSFSVTVAGTPCLRNCARLRDRAAVFPTTRCVVFLQPLRLRERLFCPAWNPRDCSPSSSNNLFQWASLATIIYWPCCWVVHTISHFLCVLEEFPWSPFFLSVDVKARLTLLNIRCQFLRKNLRPTNVLLSRNQWTSNAAIAKCKHCSQRK